METLAVGSGPLRSLTLAFAKWRYKRLNAKITALHVKEQIMKRRLKGLGVSKNDRIRLGEWP